METLSNGGVMIGGRYFASAKEAALQFQYEARLVAANSRELKRYGAMHCAWMQRMAAAESALARQALEAA